MEAKSSYIIAAGRVYNSNRIRYESKVRWNERMSFEHMIRTRYHDNVEVLHEASRLARYHVNMMFDGARYSDDIEATIMQLRSTK